MKNNINIVPVKNKEENNKLWSDFLEARAGKMRAIYNLKADVDMTPMINNAFRERYTFVAKDEKGVLGHVLAHRHVGTISIDQLVAKKDINYDTVVFGLIRAVEVRGFRKNNKRGFLDATNLHVVSNEEYKGLLLNAGFTIKEKDKFNDERLARKIRANGVLPVRRVTNETKKAFEGIYDNAQSANGLYNSIITEGTHAALYYFDDQPIALLTGKVDTSAIIYEVNTNKVQDAYKQIVTAELVNDFAKYAKYNGIDTVELQQNDWNMEALERFQKAGFVRLENSIVKKRQSHK